MNGLVLLGRAGRGSVGKGPGEARSVSCERLRGRAGGGGKSEEEAKGNGVDSEEDEEEPNACRSDRADDCRERDEGSVLEAGVHREEPRVRDWVACQGAEDEGGVSDANVSKGLGFHCASP